MVEDIIKNSKHDLEDIFNEIDKLEEANSQKVLEAFIQNNVCETDLNSATGYGYDDVGRDKIEKIYASIFKTESALVRSQFISGTHAISTCLFAILRPNDTFLSISGKPYDTLDSVIGFNDNKSSLKSFNINYKQIDLKDDDFDYDKIKKEVLNNKIKMITIQRSKGYSTRKTISIDKIEKVVKLIKNIDKNVIIMVDNCYCEMVDYKEPTEVGVDLCVGSLIKNLGGAIAQNGGYIVGKESLVYLCSERLNVPGQAFEVGPSMGQNRNIMQGVYFAPMIVANALKTAIYTAYMMGKLGYETEPKYNEIRSDIVQNIIFKDEEKLIKYVRLIQSNSKIDSNAIIEPSFMPGYDDKIIMASGSFTQGSSIELSCDGPLRYPYIAYQQGSISYKYGKIIINNIARIFEKEK